MPVIRSVDKNDTKLTIRAIRIRIAATQVRIACKFNKIPQIKIKPINPAALQNKAVFSRVTMVAHRSVISMVTAHITINRMGVTMRSNTPVRIAIKDDLDDCNSEQECMPNISHNPRVPKIKPANRKLTKPEPETFEPGVLNSFVCGRAMLRFLA